EAPAFAGIYTPQSFHGATRVGVTSQFLENAEQYHKSYFDTSYWNFLLGNALDAAGSPGAPKRIIDIGSGSGNSVIPLADHLPQDSRAGIRCRKGLARVSLHRANGRGLQAKGTTRRRRELS